MAEWTQEVEGSGKTRNGSKTLSLSHFLVSKTWDRACCIVGTGFMDPYVKTRKTFGPFCFL